MEKILQIVAMCDIDKDDYLDLSEFIAAAHISYVCHDV